MRSRRTALAALVLAVLVGASAAATALAGAPFPDPVFDQAVYDEAGILDPATIEALEARIDALEARSGAEVVIYLQVDPSQDFDSNLAAAESLMNQWGVGREAYDDGLVILVSFAENRINGVLSTYAGSGFKAAYLSQEEQTVLRDRIIVPAFQAQDVGGGLLAAMEVIDQEVTSETTSSLEVHRQLNAIVGIPGAALVLILTTGAAVFQWKRHGDDPDLVDSDAVLMAGPPADMTPPLATVLREGRATGHALRTLLVQLAGSGLVRFRNLDRVGEVKRDDPADPEVDPAIDLPDPPLDAPAPAGPLGEAYRELVILGGSDRTLTRQSLWLVNEHLDPIKRQLEQEGVRLGWLTELPTPVIRKWIAIGVGEVVLGGVSLFFGFSIPMSGLTLVGLALIAGGLVTMLFGTQMSKRTPNGAYVDAMLKAYRRTLEKTLAQARSMAEVVAVPAIRVLADTPDKAVVWGVALGLHEEVGQVLARELADPQARAMAQASGAYYPVYLGSGSSSDGSGGGSLFSGSGIPDLGGMISSLGDVGSAPASSSSSSGGGFGGGGGGGGGGGSSGF
jgi:uncharacterized membrane protein YgcG